VLTGGSVKRGQFVPHSAESIAVDGRKNEWDAQVNCTVLNDCESRKSVACCWKVGGVFFYFALHKKFKGVVKDTLPGNRIKVQISRLASSCQNRGFRLLPV
jgi:hypothetical protein